jgi:hypothetical protein
LEGGGYPTEHIAEGRPEAWVLEAQIADGPLKLFKALEALPKCGPMLEPVGIRWQAGEKGDARQFLILRNLILVP